MYPSFASWTFWRCWFSPNDFFVTSSMSSCQVAICLKGDDWCFVATDWHNKSRVDVLLLCSFVSDIASTIETHCFQFLWYCVCVVVHEPSCSFSRWLTSLRLLYDGFNWWPLDLPPTQNPSITSRFSSSFRTKNIMSQWWWRASILVGWEDKDYNHYSP